ncbi:MAG: twin transmembrane helix small protein [Alphaproteobacteria bacterium]|nr:twin transmembrane helix small protein [Alphaproteobacteria bacterium]
MSNVFLILMGIAMAAVLAVLIMGLISMVKGGEFNRKYGNRLMRWRVGLQALALVLFAIALVLGRGS